MTTRKKAEAFVKELIENGFNEVMFYEAKLPNKQVLIDDMISDGHPEGVAQEWAEDYVCMNIGADMPEGDGPYCQFDMCNFELDLREHFTDTFGKECLREEFHVDVYGGDMEIYDREKYKTYWKEKFR